MRTYAELCVLFQSSILACNIPNCHSSSKAVLHSLAHVASGLCLYKHAKKQHPDSIIAHTISYSRKASSSYGMPCSIGNLATLPSAPLAVMLIKIAGKGESKHYADNNSPWKGPLYTICIRNWMPSFCQTAAYTFKVFMLANPQLLSKLFFSTAANLNPTPSDSSSNSTAAMLRNRPAQMLRFQKIVTLGSTCIFFLSQADSHASPEPQILTSQQ